MPEAFILIEICFCLFLKKKIKKIVILKVFLGKTRRFFFKEIKKGEYSILLLNSFSLAKKYPILQAKIKKGEYSLFLIPTK